MTTEGLNGLVGDYVFAKSFRGPYPGLFMTYLLRFISPKIPLSHSSTMRYISCGARFWAFGADFTSLRKFMNSRGYEDISVYSGVACEIDTRMSNTCEEPRQANSGHRFAQFVSSFATYDLSSGDFRDVDTLICAEG